jgi:superfamily II DNA/RNA helicase
MSSATITSNVHKAIETHFDTKDPNFARMIEQKSHQNLTNLDHAFVHLAEHDKYKPLDGLLREFTAYSKKHKTSCIIFCNSIQSARSAGHFLTEKGY